ncbi:hypothetical protein ACFSUS_10270 [Spirosoma soli]|uniref:Uncharacterized protein n=1 Tax=Spirosoma soli TaxID=1770529 RepID=A0ABW5M3Y3_9BACT
MAHIAIPIPSLPGKQDIEIEVTINGQKQALHYRVELFYWGDCNIPTFDRVECIQQHLAGYDQDWKLYYIGAPTDDFVPVTFVKKEDWEKQRKLLTMS